MDGGSDRYKWQEKVVDSAQIDTTVCRLIINKINAIKSQASLTPLVKIFICKKVMLSFLLVYKQSVILRVASILKSMVLDCIVLPFW